MRDVGAFPAYLLKDREAIERGQIAGPHILSALGFVTVPGGYPEHYERIPNLMQRFVGTPARYARTASEATDHVKRYRDEGADLVKIAFDHRSNLYGRGAINTLSDAQVEAIKNEAERLGMPVAAHHLYARGLDRGLQFSIDSMEHIATDELLTEAQVRAVVDSKTAIVPTATPGMNLA